MFLRRQQLCTAVPACTAIPGPCNKTSVNRCTDHTASFPAARYVSRHRGASVYTEVVPPGRTSSPPGAASPPRRRPARTTEVRRFLTGGPHTADRRWELVRAVPGAWSKRALRSPPAAVRPAGTAVGMDELHVRSRAQRRDGVFRVVRLREGGRGRRRGPGPVRGCRLGSPTSGALGEEWGRTLRGMAVSPRPEASPGATDVKGAFRHRNIRASVTCRAGPHGHRPREAPSRTDAAVTRREAPGPPAAPGP